jgi:hypothetical protein
VFEFIVKELLSTVEIGRGLKLSLEELKLLEVGVTKGHCILRKGDFLS